MKRSRSPVAVAATTVVVALVLVGWALYFVKVSSLAGEETLDSAIRYALVVASGLTVLALHRRIGRVTTCVLLGVAAVSLVTLALGGPALEVAFACGTVVLGAGWLLARRGSLDSATGDRELAAFLRGRGGVTLVLLAPALVAVPALAGFDGLYQVIFTLAALLGAAIAARLCRGSWRLLARCFVVLASVLLVLEGLLVYDLYPFATIAFLGGGALVAGVPAFFKLTRGERLRQPGPPQPARNGGYTTKLTSLSGTTIARGSSPFR
jgi:hypothetical protein